MVEEQWTPARWTPLALGILGGLSGLVVSFLFPWLLVKLTPGSRWAIDDFGEARLITYMSVMLYLFLVALVVSLASLKAPSVCGLILIVVGVLSLALSAYGATVKPTGGILLVPSGLLVLLAGASMVTRARAAPAVPQ